MHADGFWIIYDSICKNALKCSANCKKQFGFSGFCEKQHFVSLG